MILFKRANALHSYLVRQRDSGKRISFVPTMGALHEGHISLVREGRSGGALCVASIFINPTQFNDPADFQKYPVTLEKDIAMLENAGCDVLFLPSVAEVYPTGTTSVEKYDLGFLETVYEGQYRPGHFQGVCMVVHRLLEMVGPVTLFLGRKDYQQCLVIARMLELTGLKGQVALRIVPTVREADGLAMSSRNRRLSDEQRKIAAAIHDSLTQLQAGLQPGSLEAIRQKAVATLTTKGFRVDYIGIASTESLEPVGEWDGKTELVALAAAFLGDIRLIDNIVLNQAS